MNNWLVFALFSLLVYVAVNFIDKYLIEKKGKNYRGMPIYVAIMGGVMGLLFWITTGLKPLPLYDFFLILLSGMFQILSTALYFPAFLKKILVRQHLFTNYYLALSFVLLCGSSTNYCTYVSSLCTT